jgi:hypothetical protein
MRPNWHLFVSTHEVRPPAGIPSAVIELAVAEAREEGLTCDFPDTLPSYGAPPTTACHRDHTPNVSCTGSRHCPEPAASSAPTSCAVVGIPT